MFHILQPKLILGSVKKIDILGPDKIGVATLTKHNGLEILIIGTLMCPCQGKTTIVLTMFYCSTVSAMRLGQWNLNVLVNTCTRVVSQW